MEHYAAILKTQTIDMYDDLDRSQGNCCEWEKPSLKSDILYDFVYTIVLK